MIEGQTAIPVPEAQPPSGPCRWCGKPSVGTVQTEKARYRDDRGTKVMARAPIEVPACGDHIEILERQPTSWLLLNEHGGTISRVQAESAEEAREMFLSMGLTGTSMRRARRAA